MDLFSFHVSPLELVVRGTLIYWFLFLMFRFVLRRDVGSVGIADVLLVVLIADASQNAMAGGYETVAEGCVLVLTLMGWNWALDWASYRFDSVRRFAEPPPLLLVRHGRVLHRNLRQEFLTLDDLQSQLRQNGVSNLAEVRTAFMESDGRFSVITRDGRQARGGASADSPATDG
ncbi:YetF domain-containing protein [Rhizobacter sp. SG703]|uniref:DUF421 domain-containing protein n=1 Tax=Rhizobacter sp. SG703 TaxID=2587140 RepID=UPI001444F582|nr:YetF domain-containing protein [Rhizobacter sp. SG703]NKI94634.1 uncharacterized membrane protein YcaP (DUF421 family) [Rhizobacter sp. SG703]